MRRFVGAVAVVASTSVVLFAAQPAYATYPGENGLIALSIDRGNGAQLYTIRPNGTDLTRLTSLRGEPA